MDRANFRRLRKVASCSRLSDSNDLEELFLRYPQLGRYRRNRIESIANYSVS